MKAKDLLKVLEIRQQRRIKPIELTPDITLDELLAKADKFTKECEEMRLRVARMEESNDYTEHQYNRLHRDLKQCIRLLF